MKGKFLQHTKFDLLILHVHAAVCIMPYIIIFIRHQTERKTKDERKSENTNKTTYTLTLTAAHRMLLILGGRMTKRDRMQR